MIKQLIRQTIELLRHNVLLSVISILGTAFAICLIMVMVIAWQVKYRGAPPETNLERTMFIKSFTVRLTSQNGWYTSWYCTPALMKDLVLPSPYIETATSATAVSVAVLATPDESARASVDFRYTDAMFWKVYEFDFIDGRPFADTDLQDDGSEAIVISAGVARRLFGTEHVAGRSVLMNRHLKRIVGVVRDPSLTAIHAYAQLWCMYPANLLRTPKEADEYAGDFEISILARNAKDFQAIYDDIHNRKAQMNTSLADYELDIYNQPDDSMTARNRIFPDPDMKGMYWQYGIVLFIILLVPALNLCGLSSSRMQQRMSELGVRKAYGNTRMMLVRRILDENLVLTILGGIVGFVFSYGAVYLLRGWIFSTFWTVYSHGEIILPVSSLFSPAVFAYALLFCLLMNLLSAGIPAWYASRKPIVVSLNDN